MTFWGIPIFWGKLHVDELMVVRDTEIGDAPIIPTYIHGHWVIDI